MTKSYRVRVLDSRNVTHVLDIEASHWRVARSEAFASIKSQLTDAEPVYTRDVHTVSASGGYGALYFRHSFEK